MLTACLGAEEELLEGISDVLGDAVPVIGGSAADCGVSLCHVSTLSTPPPHPIELIAAYF